MSSECLPRFHGSPLLKQQCTTLVVSCMLTPSSENYKTYFLFFLFLFSVVSCHCLCKLNLPHFFPLMGPTCFLLIQTIAFSTTPIIQHVSIHQFFPSVVSSIIVSPLFSHSQHSSNCQPVFYVVYSTLVSLFFH